jgi:hypothetical protein
MTADQYTLTSLCMSSCKLDPISLQDVSVASLQALTELYRQWVDLSTVPHKYAITNKLLCNLHTYSSTHLQSTASFSTAAPSQIHLGTKLPVQPHGHSDAAAAAAAQCRNNGSVEASSTSSPPPAEPQSLSAQEAPNQSVGALPARTAVFQVLQAVLTVKCTLATITATAPCTTLRSLTIPRAAEIAPSPSISQGDPEGSRAMSTPGGLRTATAVDAPQPLTSISASGERIISGDGSTAVAATAADTAATAAAAGDDDVYEPMDVDLQTLARCSGERYSAVQLELQLAVTEDDREASLQEKLLYMVGLMTHGTIDNPAAWQVRPCDIISLSQCEQMSPIELSICFGYTSGCAVIDCPLCLWDLRRFPAPALPFLALPALLEHLDQGPTVCRMALFFLDLPPLCALPASEPATAMTFQLRFMHCVPSYTRC